MLRRAAFIYPDMAAVRYGTRAITWSQVYQRSAQVAQALNDRGVGKGDTVAILSANIPEMFEAHFAVPMAGAVLNAINMRLDAATVAFILEHGEAKLLLVDKEFGPLAEAALARMDAPIEVIHIDDETYHDEDGIRAYRDHRDFDNEAQGPHYLIKSGPLIIWRAAKDIPEDVRRNFLLQSQSTLLPSVQSLLMALLYIPLFTHRPGKEKIP